MNHSVAAGQGPTRHRSLTDRIFRILDAFAGTEDSLTPAEIVRRTGLPKTTVHRIISDLVEVGMLQRIAGELCLGVHLFELGSMVPANKQLREVALPFMWDLHEATHEIVHLGILDGPDVVYLVKISGHERMPLPTRDGARMPAHATGLGKALLAASPRSVVQRLIRQPLRAVTPHTVVDRDVLLDELAQVARTGVAYDYEECIPGVVCVGAPITLPGRPPRAAVSVTGPRDRYDPRSAANAVRVVGFAISRALGATPSQG